MARDAVGLLREVVVQARRRLADTCVARHAAYLRLTHVQGVRELQRNFLRRVDDARGPMLGTRCPKGETHKSETHKGHSQQE